MTQFLKIQSDIAAWLDRQNIKNYTIKPDLTVDVNDSVDLEEKNLTFIPVKFSRVYGTFNCSHNRLTDLLFSPTYVEYFFDCSENCINSLVGSPEHIGQGLYCAYNQITSLKGLSAKLGGSLYCHDNQITSFLGCPEHVSGSFHFHHNPIASFDFFPLSVLGSIMSNKTNLPLELQGIYRKGVEFYPLKNQYEHIMCEQKMLSENVSTPFDPIVHSIKNKI